MTEETNESATAPQTNPGKVLVIEEPISDSLTADLLPATSKVDLNKHTLSVTGVRVGRGDIFHRIRCSCSKDVNTVVGLSKTALRDIMNGVKDSEHYVATVLTTHKII
jgi:hypothetical protein